MFFLWHFTETPKTYEEPYIYKIYYIYTYIYILYILMCLNTSYHIRPKNTTPMPPPDPPGKNTPVDPASRRSCRGNPCFLKDAILMWCGHWLQYLDASIFVYKLSFINKKQSFNILKTKTRGILVFFPPWPAFLFGRPKMEGLVRGPITMTKRRMSLRRNQTNLKTERHWPGRRQWKTNAGNAGRHGEPTGCEVRYGTAVIMVKQGMVYDGICVFFCWLKLTPWKFLEERKLVVSFRKIHIDTVCVFAWKLENPKCPCALPKDVERKYR